MTSLALQQQDFGILEQFDLTMYCNASYQDVAQWPLKARPNPSFYTFISNKEFGGNA